MKPLRKGSIRNAEVARLCLIYGGIQQVRIIYGSVLRQLNPIRDFAVLYAWYGKVKLSPRSWSSASGAAGGSLRSRLETIV